MSHYYNHQETPADVYPPPPTSYPTSVPPQKGPYVAPPPVGYPMKNDPQVPHQPSPPASQSRGFGKGCCAGLCCCCLLDACF